MTHAEEMDNVKRAIIMVHGRVSMEELPDNFYRVVADILQNTTDPKFRGGVIACALNLVGAQIDQTLVIKDYT